MGCGSSAATGGASNPGKSGKVKLGYWGNLRGGPRGNASKFLLNYCKVNYEDVTYSFADQDGWKAFKAASDIPFCNLPYLVDGDVKMSETMAIFQYIAGKWKPELLGKTP